MRRFRIALVAGLATLALGAIGAPIAAASNGTNTPNNIPPLKTVSVLGKAQNGKQFTNGTYAIQRFAPGPDNKVDAVGTLKGTLDGRRVTRYDVMIPVTGMPTTGSSTSAARTAQATTCTVLNLQLGPIDLNLLGLRVQLFGGTNANNPLPISLLITANPGQGLLGQLLCSLTSSQLSTILSGLSSNLNQLAATLTGLTSLLAAV